MRLTGNKRIINDSCVDLYNCVQKWIRIVAEGQPIVVSVCLKLKKKIEDSSLYEEDQDEDGSHLAELQNQSSRLTLLVENLELIVQKMRKIESKFKSLQELSALEQSKDTEELDPVYFLSWPLSKFVSLAEKVASTHSKELRIKQAIVQELCTLTKVPQLTLYENCWKYETQLQRSEVTSMMEGIMFELQLFTS